MDTDKIWKILGSKWTMLLVALALLAAFPPLFHNAKVVISYPEVPTGLLIRHIAVLLIDVIAIFMAMFKFMSMTFSNKDKQVSVSNENSQFN